MINLDLNSLGSEFFEGFLTNLRRRVFELYSCYGYLHESPKLVEVYREWYREILEGVSNDALLSYSIYHLSHMLEMHFGKRAVILIDGCDDAFNTFCGMEYHRKVSGS